MNQQIKQQWTAALRSGEYQQTYGEIRNGSDEYCANGVLCELHSLAVMHRGGWQQLGKRYAWFYLLHRFPDENVRDWAEVDTDTLLEIERLNDKERLTFNELAAYIDNNL